MRRQRGHSELVKGGHEPETDRDRVKEIEHHPTHRDEIKREREHHPTLLHRGEAERRRVRSEE